MTDGLSWGDGGPRTAGWQQQGQQAERGWQRKPKVSIQSLSPPAGSFILWPNSSHGHSPCGRQRFCVSKSGRHHPVFPAQNIPPNPRPDGLSFLLDIIISQLEVANTQLWVPLPPSSPRLPHLRLGCFRPCLCSGQNPGSSLVPHSLLLSTFTPTVNPVGSVLPRQPAQLCVS